MRRLLKKICYQVIKKTILLIHGKYYLTPFRFNGFLKKLNDKAKMNSITTNFIFQDWDRHRFPDVFA